MNVARRALPCLLLVANAVPAQGPAETLLSADAAGTTRVQFDSTAPAASRTLATLAERVANLHVSAGRAGSFGDLISLRGLSNTPYFSDPAVTVYFDDLPLGSTFSSPTDLFGFASASVVRGPQGSAFGRGGEGGVILLTSAEPGAMATGELRASVGNFNLRSAAFDVRSASNGPVDMSVSASFLQRDGYIQNRTPGVPADNQLAYSGAARLRFRPSATSEVSLQLLGQRRRDGAQPLVMLNGPTGSLYGEREGSTDIDFGGAALKAAFETSVGRLTSTTSRTEWKLMPYENHLVLPSPLESHIDQSQRVWNEELRLASGPKSLVTWHVGAWFSDEKTDGNVNRTATYFLTGGFFNPLTGTLTPQGAPVAVPFQIEASKFHLNSRTSALFAEATVPPNIGWTVTAGLRVEETRRDFSRNVRVLLPGRFAAQKSLGAVLPKLSASYAFTNETTASATLSAGWKPGGWSASTGNAALADFRPEKTTALEAGVDTSFADKTVTVAARVFAYRIRDYQIERLFSADDYLVVNARRARSVGAELEGSWRPTPELIFTGSFGCTSVELRSFTDPFTRKNLSGKRAPYAPEYEAHVCAIYRGKNGWFAAAECVAVGKTHFDETGSADGMAGAYRVFNGRIGYEAARWRVSIYGENLGSEEYTTMIIPRVQHAVPGAPRTYGVEAGMKW
ncbi:MAG TPA: TonB-dependent receptor [Opitutaceae bacterium]|nr:TonB-dependent receptor [Opitutaceae bacterium]